MSTNEALVLLRLPSISVGQILDGLDVLIEQWNHTAGFLRTGDFSEEIGIVRECSAAEEAKSISVCYQEIRLEIAKQLESRKQEV
jgi:hypothetical protein